MTPEQKLFKAAKALVYFDFEKAKFIPMESASQDDADDAMDVWNELVDAVKEYEQRTNQTKK